MFREIKLTVSQRKAAVKRAYGKRAPRGSISKTAKELGISVVTLKAWFDKYGV